jgi:signal transduction histidine kinase
LQAQHGLTLVEHGPCEVQAGGDKLEQVLLHLVQNAIDVSPPDTSVVVSVGSDGTSGAIEVVDCGPGMSAEFIRSRLFRPFDSTKPGGFGIGAFEARELVRGMGGQLEVDSREGLGTRFTILLPLARADAQAKAA